MEQHRPRADYNKHSILSQGTHSDKKRSQGPKTRLGENKVEPVFRGQTFSGCHGKWHLMMNYGRVANDMNSLPARKILQ